MIFHAGRLKLINNKDVPLEAQSHLYSRTCFISCKKKLQKFLKMINIFLKKVIKPQTQPDRANISSVDRFDIRGLSYV